jgi:hypothetical protein
MLEGTAGWKAEQAGKLGRLEGKAGWKAEQAGRLGRQES